MPAIGRKVLGRAKVTEDLHARLLARRSVAVATGQGGIGKTTLARHYVETHGKHYRGVLWVRAEDPTTLVADLGLLAAAVKVDGCEQMAPEQKARALLSALDGLEQDWLIVFDNAPDGKALKAWMPGGARVRVLVTSRSTHWPPAFARLAPDLLATGKRSDAGPVLLMQEACRHDDPDGALELARELGGLPLALVAAGGLIRERGGSYSEYREKLAAVLADVPSGDYRDSVIGAVKLSYDTLDADAKTVLDLFAWFAPEGLEARLLTDAPRSDLLPEFRETFADRFLNLCGEPERIEAALTRLIRRSLLVGQEERFTMHRMTAVAIRTIQRDAGTHNECALSAASALATSFPSGTRPADTPYWPICARLIPHVLALHRAWLAAKADPIVGEALDYVFGQAYIYLPRIGEVRPALAMAKANLRLKCARLPHKHEDVAKAWSALGGAHQINGSLCKGVAAHRKSVRLGEMHGHSFQRISTARNNFADALREYGLASGNREALKIALENARIALRLACEAFGHRSVEAAIAMGQLGRSHGALGHMPIHLACILDMLNTLQDLVRRRELSEVDWRLGNTLQEAGEIHLRLDQPDLALLLLREALTVLRTAYGRNEHPEVRSTASSLVTCLLALARRDPTRAAEAQGIAAEFGLDWEEYQRAAAQFPGPMDAPAPPG